jgi:hypothetical protein
MPIIYSGQLYSSPVLVLLPIGGKPKTWNLFASHIKR